MTASALLARVLAAALPAGLVLAAAAPAEAQERSLRLRGTIAERGDYLYLPFTVPPGTRSVAVDVRAEQDEGEPKLGAGLFDERGPGFGLGGFRGILGEERSSFRVSARTASRGFLPGTIRPGRWTVVVPAFAADDARVTAIVRLRLGAPSRPRAAEPAPETVRAGRRWYRGDLHAHTTSSSDAEGSGSGRTPEALARLARRRGLDFLSLTDHNVVDQNLRMRSAAPPGLLLLGGQEVTTWFDGHLTATGLGARERVDWRAVPRGRPARSPRQGRMRELLRDARGPGTYSAAAHPSTPGGGVPWGFFPEAERDRASLPDGLEVWNGVYKDFDDRRAIAEWDRQLAGGRRVCGSGGSDVHGVRNDAGIAVGEPTTVVLADALSRRAVTAALRACRAYVTSGPDGPGLSITATGPGGQQRSVGGRIVGGADDVVDVAVDVAGGAGRELVLVRDGVELPATRITRERERVTATLRVGGGGAVRAELRGEPRVVPGRPLASPDGLEALTNPIFLRRGAVPERPVRETAPRLR